MSEEASDEDRQEGDARKQKGQMAVEERLKQKRHILDLLGDELEGLEEQDVPKRQQPLSLRSKRRQETKRGRKQTSPSPKPSESSRAVSEYVKNYGLDHDKLEQYLSQLFPTTIINVEVSQQRRRIIKHLLIAGRSSCRIWGFTR